MAKLETGATAPAFTLPDQDGKPVKLSDFKGQRVIVYFYPADDTPGCTKEACQFNDNLKTFEKAGVTVLGISPDKAEKHVKFRTKYKLKFPLLTDAVKKAHVTVNIGEDDHIHIGAWTTLTLQRMT